MAKQGQSNRKGKAFGGIKALVSISALASTLVGWGLLAKDSQQDVIADRPADIGALLEDILGPLPTLPGTSANQDEQATTGLTLRPVSLPAQSASGPAPVTRTQSSR
jgi:hypothetical protein